jgi:uncharacterized protein YjbI with pentapeptide repeats
MTRPNTNRTTCGVCALLAAVVLAGVAALGVRLWPYWVAKYHGRGADLHRAILTRAPLRGVDLEESNLQGASLARADLQGARLLFANLKNAILAHASLVGACLLGAHLQHANLAGANLTEAVISIECRGFANLQDANLQGATMDGAALGDAFLRGADLRNARLRSACLRGTDLQGADLRGADLGGTDLSGGNLTGAHYDKATRWPAGFDPALHGAVRVPSTRVKGMPEERGRRIAALRPQGESKLNGH